MTRQGVVPGRNNVFDEQFVLIMLCGSQVKQLAPQTLVGSQIEYEEENRVIVVVHRHGSHCVKEQHIKSQNRREAQTDRTEQAGTDSLAR